MKYTFYDDSHSSECGIQCFNSDDIRCGLGIAYSVESCYIQAILTETGQSNSYSDVYWGMNLDQLKEEAKKLGVKVEIIS